MTNEFDEVMAQRTDAELIKILNSRAGDYQPAALEAAKRVFDSRNLSDEQVAEAKQEIEYNPDQNERDAQEPLGTGLKVLAFIFPGCLLIFVALIYYSTGYKQRAKELVKWMLYGLSAQLIFLGLAFAVNYFSMKN